ncbi:hypothetical protein K474DRAFT_1695444 [Panus rudis PR-1116 ss-1]|nr:hypothetical protein K474DRAFT_1695444 [Panus rudis PR-1116 ss-1]
MSLELHLPLAHFLVTSRQTMDICIDGTRTIGGSVNPNRTKYDDAVFARLQDDDQRLKYFPVQPSPEDTARMTTDQILKNLTSFNCRRIEISGWFTIEPKKGHQIPSTGMIAEGAPREYSEPNSEKDTLYHSYSFSREYLINNSGGEETKELSSALKLENSNGAINEANKGKTTTHRLGVSNDIQYDKELTQCFHEGAHLSNGSVIPREVLTGMIDDIESFCYIPPKQIPDNCKEPIMRCMRLVLNGPNFEQFVRYIVDARSIAEIFWEVQ